MWAHHEKLVVIDQVIIQPWLGPKPLKLDYFPFLTFCSSEHSVCQRNWPLLRSVGHCQTQVSPPHLSCLPHASWPQAVWHRALGDFSARAQQNPLWTKVSRRFVHNSQLFESIWLWFLLNRPNLPQSEHSDLLNQWSLESLECFKWISTSKDLNQN